MVYVNGSATNAGAFLAGIYKASYRTATAGANVLNYGATGNGVTDDSQAFNAALAASDTVLVPSGTFLIASPVTVRSNKSLVGTSSTSVIKPKRSYGLVIQGTNIVVQNIHFVGSLSTQQQYKRDGNFSPSMFNGAALVDGTGKPVPASQASVSILDANRLSVTVHGSSGSPTGPFYLTGNFPGLNPSARYYLRSSANFIAGDGALLPAFQLNDSTAYIPGNSSGTPYFTATNTLGMQLAVGRAPTDASSLTAVFEVSDLSLVHAVNEMAAIDTTNDENNCYIYVESSQNVYFFNNDFDLFDAAVLKVNQTQNLYFLQNTIRQSFGGITAQSGANNFFVNNSIDNRLMDDAGNLLNHSIIRAHGFSLSYDPAGSSRENNVQIVSNKIVGASWGVESPVALLNPNVSFNAISAGQVGISLANEYGTIASNTITLDGISLMGIEVPTDGVNPSHDVTISGNAIDMSASSLYDVGLSASNGAGTNTDLYNFSVSNNVIAAPIGFQFLDVAANSEPNIALHDNQVTHLGLPGFIRPSSGSDFVLATDTQVAGNTFACVGSVKFWGLSTIVPASGCP